MADMVPFDDDSPSCLPCVQTPTQTLNNPNQIVLERYAAKVAGLMPSGDDWEVATAEGVGAFMMDVSD